MPLCWGVAMLGWVQGWSGFVAATECAFNGNTMAATKPWRYRRHGYRRAALSQRLCIFAFFLADSIFS